MPSIFRTLQHSWSLLYQACCKEKWNLFILVCVFLGVLLGIALNLFIPFTFKNITNSLSLNYNRTTHTVFLLAAIYSLTWTLAQIIEQLREIIICPILEKTISEATLQYYLKLIKTASFNKSTGKELNILYFFQEGFPNLLWGIFFYIIPTSLQVLFATLILHSLYGFTYSILFFMLILCFVGVTFYGIKIYLSRQTSAINQSSFVSEFLVDRLVNKEIIDLFSTTNRESETLKSKLEALELCQVKAKISMEALRLVQGLIVGVGLSIATLLSALAVNNQTLSLGDFILINSYIIQLLVPMSSLGFILTDISKGLSGVKKLMNFLSTSSPLQPYQQTEKNSSFIDRIDFQSVHFSYPQKDQESLQVISNLNLTFNVNKSIAIVGPSGSGKTTLLQLLIGRVKPTKGNILINNQELSLTDYTSLFSVVPQNITLLNETLINNILFSNPDATEHQLENAINLSCLDDLINRLPKGLNTKVGELGYSLSGGEKQRVAIARAFLKRPSIGLVFDEATSALDPMLADKLMQNFLNIPSYAFKIMIVHQQKFLKEFDEVIFIKEGKIISIGKHHDLIKQCLPYQEFWTTSN